MPVAPQLTSPSRTRQGWLTSPVRSLLGVLALLAVGSGCSILTPFAVRDAEPGDAGADGTPEADTDLDADAEPVDADGADADAEATDADGADADAPPCGLAGPVTFVSSSATMTSDRVFDFNGDGTLDNAVADLGVTDAALFVAVVSGLFEISLRNGHTRWLLHSPHLEDATCLNDPDATIILMVGRDEWRHVDPGEDPEDPLEDDFTGTEDYFVHGSSLDACGEPLHYYLHTPVEDGVCEISGGPIKLPLLAVLPLETFRSRSAPLEAGRGLSMVLAGIMRVGDLGMEEAPRDFVDPELNLLEVLLAGGPAFGVPSVPGLTPDLDLDGDGVEIFELDADFHLARCVDGDFTVVEGRDCWQDPRFADAISVTTRWEYAPAVFAGPEELWDHRVEGSCDDPPETSLFDPS